MSIRKLYAVVLAALLGLSAALPSRAAQPDIYPAPEQASTDLSAALKTAAARHLRVIVDFGGNWCTDCHVLDLYMHDANNAPILEANFVVVHVNIGRMDSNLDVAARYDVPINKGVPALAVLESDGRLLYAQKTGEFESMRHMESGAVTQFLQHWKPGSRT
jgi:thioredoxin 1